MNQSRQIKIWTLYAGIIAPCSMALTWSITVQFWTSTRTTTLHSKLTQNKSWMPKNCGVSTFYILTFIKIFVSWTKMSQTLQTDNIPIFTSHNSQLFFSEDTVLLIDYTKHGQNCFIILFLHFSTDSWYNEAVIPIMAYIWLAPQLPRQPLAVSRLYSDTFTFSTNQQSLQIATPDELNQVSPRTFLTFFIPLNNLHGVLKGAQYGPLYCNTQLLITSPNPGSSMR